MPIPKKWSKFNNENIDKVPRTEGAYEFSFRGTKESRIGSSKDLPRRLSEHHRDPAMKKCTRFRVQKAGPFSTGKDLEAKLAKRYAEKNPDSPKPSLSKRLPKKRGLFDW